MKQLPELTYRSCLLDRQCHCMPRRGVAAPAKVLSLTKELLISYKVIEQANYQHS
jgi:hypothetical protein